MKPKLLTVPTTLSQKEVTKATKRKWAKDNRNKINAEYKQFKMTIENYNQLIAQAEKNNYYPGRVNEYLALLLIKGES